MTFSSTDNTTFTVGNLATYTTPFGGVRLHGQRRRCPGPLRSGGNRLTVGQLHCPVGQRPADDRPRFSDHHPATEPVSSVGVTFSKPIDPTTFTTAALNLTRDGVPVLLGSDVTITTTDDTTFSINGLTSYTTPPAPYSLTINAADVKDLAGNPGTGSQSIDFVVQAPVVDTGPQIVGFQRFGVHNQPTLLVLTFDRQLDPASAGNPNNYLIYGPGRPIGGPKNVLLPILSGVYDSANKTVTLVMARPLYLYGQYRIVVLGTGPHPITDLNGVALDGESNGVPGSNFATLFGREILAGVTPTSGTLKTKGIPARAPLLATYRHYQIGG